jgi:peptidoglycan DL-endopeptidase RipA
MTGRRAAVGLLSAVVASAVVTGPSGASAQPRPRPSQTAVHPSKAAVRASQAAVRAALARANAKVTAADKVLSALETHAEVLTERYDQATWAEQQAAAAYNVATARLAAARRAQLANARKLAQQAAADLEAGGDQGPAALMFGGSGGPGAYFNAVGLEEVLADQRVDLVTASQADDTVTNLFKKQAASLLAVRRADQRAADSLRTAVEAAVRVQQAVVQADKSRQRRLAAKLAQAETAKGGGMSSGGGVPAPVAGTAPVAGKGAGVQPAWTPGAGTVATAAQGVTAADWALTQLGKPYQWGGAGPATYDCSGLAMDAWATAGVRLAHWTGYQWVSGPHVPLSQLRAGDLVFYATNVANPATIHHVGIYIGQGLMVDAPYTGADVRVDSIHQYAGLIGATRPAAY